MHINLSKDSVAGVDESMRRIRRDNDNAARFYLALFISDRDRGAAFEGECDLDVRMRVQRRPLFRFGVDYVGREWRALRFANEFMRHSHKRQLLEIDEAHNGRKLSRNCASLFSKYFRGFQRFGANRMRES
jgi:hypothetical protein